MQPWRLFLRVCTGKIVIIIPTLGLISVWAWHALSGDSGYEIETALGSWLWVGLWATFSVWYFDHILYQCCNATPLQTYIMKNRLTKDDFWVYHDGANGDYYDFWEQTVKPVMVGCECSRRAWVHTFVLWLSLGFLMSPYTPWSVDRTILSRMFIATTERLGFVGGLLQKMETVYL